MIHLIAASHAPTLPERVDRGAGAGARRVLAGAADGEELIAVRDPHGFRPLVLGNLNGATIVARRPARWIWCAPSMCARSIRAR